MITRFRFEAEDQNEENVEEQLNEAIAVTLDTIVDLGDEATWVQTDKIVMPMKSEQGDAVMYGRVVYKREPNG